MKSNEQNDFDDVGYDLEADPRSIERMKSRQLIVIPPQTSSVGRAAQQQKKRNETF